MSVRGALIGLAVLCAARPLASQGDGTRVQVQAPKDFGYLVGDTLALRVTVEVPPDFELEGRSLQEEATPEWLEVRERAWDVRDRRDGRLYRFRFVYQLFYAPDSLTRLEIPERRLRFRPVGAGEPVEAVVPGLSFTISPITDGVGGMAPGFDVPAPPTLRIELGAAALLVLLAAWGLWRVLEGRRRRRRVFWRAHQEVESARTCADAALALHRALEERTGSAVFGDDLDALVERWPPAEQVREELERFFALSEALFYADGGSGAPADCLDRLRALSRRLRDLERRTGNGRRLEGRLAWTSSAPGS